MTLEVAKNKLDGLLIGLRVPTTWKQGWNDLDENKHHHSIAALRHGAACTVFAGNHQELN
jgi:hypothetical protein